MLLGYRSYVGVGGWTGVVRIHTNWHYLGYSGHTQALEQHIGLGLFALALMFVFWVWRRAEPEILMLAVLLMFVVVTPGFAKDYLMWPLPLAIAFATPPTWFYIWPASMFAALGYLTDTPVKTLIYLSLVVVCGRDRRVAIRPAPRLHSSEPESRQGQTGRSQIARSPHARCDSWSNPRDATFNGVARIDDRLRGALPRRHRVARIASENDRQPGGGCRVVRRQRRSRPPRVAVQHVRLVFFAVYAAIIRSALPSPFGDVFLVGAIVLIAETVVQGWFLAGLVIAPGANRTGDRADACSMSRCSGAHCSPAPRSR